MTYRERLIELIQNAVNGCARHWAEIIADHLLANGVIVPPCNVGDRVWFEDRYIQFPEPRIVEATVRTITYHISEEKRTWWLFIGYIDSFGYYVTTDAMLGSKVFLAKEELEQALKEREQNDR